MYNTTTIKPGEFKPCPNTVSLVEHPEFTIVNDNAIILFIKNNPLFGEITVCGGDGPLACGDQVFDIPPGEDMFIYLESGRYARHVDGKLKIKICSDQAFPVCVLQMA